MRSKSARDKSKITKIYAIPSFKTSACASPKTVKVNDASGFYKQQSFDQSKGCTVYDEHQTPIKTRGLAT